MTRSALLLFPVCFLFSACAHPTGTGESVPPNILFIMSDDHTAQAWGLYGGVLQDVMRTPNIQRLAEQGAVLNNVFCTNSICVPSRGSILTGQYSHRNGIRTLNDALHPDSLNIAKVLRRGGYQTALVGKWHLKERPAGFDYYMVLPGQGRYHDPVLRTAADWEMGGRTYPGFSADVIADQTIEWLEARDREQPFFLMTHFKATHEPFDYPERYRDLYEDREMPEPASLYDFGPAANGRSFIGQSLDILGRRWVQASQDSEAGWTRYPGLPFTLEGLDSLQARRKVYQKFVKDFLRSGAAIDDNIGKLLDYLEREGLTENTVVIYTADQGYFLGEHGFMDKRMIYEEALRMPFVIRYQAEVEAGRRLDDLVLNIDFPALFADYAGLEVPALIQGRSFRDNLQGRTPADWRRAVYYRYWQHLDVRPAHFGIRTDRYKLAFFYGQPLGLPGTMTTPTTPAWEFYDLQEDPHELRNAIDDPAYRPVIDSLKVELQQLRAQVGDTDGEYPVMGEIIRGYWE